MTINVTKDTEQKGDVTTPAGKYAEKIFGFEFNNKKGKQQMLIDKELVIALGKYVSVNDYDLLSLNQTKYTKEGESRALWNFSGFKSNKN